MTHSLASFIPVDTMKTRRRGVPIENYSIPGWRYLLYRGEGSIHGWKCLNLIWSSTSPTWHATFVFYLILRCFCISEALIKSPSKRFKRYSILWADLKGFGARRRCPRVFTFVGNLISYRHGVYINSKLIIQTPEISFYCAGVGQIFIKALRVRA